MKRPMFPRFFFVSRSVVVTTLVTTSALGCINGHEFHPTKTRAIPLGPVEKLKFDTLKSEGVKPVELPKPAVERPVIAFQAPELPPVFAEYAAKFGRERAGGHTATFERWIDYTVALIRLGRTAEAITELQALEGVHPGRYETAANLGTACELAGKLEDALTWIQRGIERNPHSHGGTEWLHVAILRAKLALEKDPAWLAQHSVLEGFEQYTTDDILFAIDYQLGERLVFVRPHDAVVCDLFFQAARRVAKNDARREAYLRESLRFGDWRKAEVDAALKG